MPESTDAGEKEPRRARRWFRYAFGGIAVLVLGLAVLLGVAFYRLRDALPGPTGELACGRTTFYWTDETRAESISPESDLPRELRVDVWYPAESVVGTPAPYCADYDLLYDALGFERYAIGRVATHTLADPPIHRSPPDRFPVVLLSPGNAMNAAWYTALVEDLVSHGYVVAAIDHPHESAAIAYPNGRIVTVLEPTQPFDPAAFERSYRDRVAGRAADLSFVLDRLQALDDGEGDTPLAHRLDLEKVGVLGHSIGGVAAAKAGQLDPRFRAAVNLDGHFAGKAFIPGPTDTGGPNDTGPTQPFLEMCDSEPVPTDEQLAQWNTTRQQYEKARQEVNDLMRSPSGSFRVSIDGANHETFADNALWYPTQRSRRLSQARIIRDFVRAFFDQTLLGNEGDWSRLQASPPAGVSVEQFRLDADP